MDFKEKNILVVGGTSGIGLSLVNILQARQANVYVISRSEPDNLPADVKHLQLDVLQEMNTMSTFLPEKLHGLVYCVGSINLKPLTRLSEDDFLTDYKLNVIGAAKVVQQSLKQLKNAEGASVVLLSSVAANLGMPYHASVSAAKAAVQGLALSLAAELVAQKIRVNVIAPSLTDTPMAQNLLNTPEKKEGSAKRHPMGKYGNPEDISESIAFLLSDNSSWMTGQIIGIDGGMGKLKTN
ncbi:MAG: SDR family oxidoreductase [Pedobacter sp.]|nr:MAG: SDR family oxidoreductase [Pedobacter sp.]